MRQILRAMSVAMALAIAAPAFAAPRSTTQATRHSQSDQKTKRTAKRAKKSRKHRKGAVKHKAAKKSTKSATIR